MEVGKRLLEPQSKYTVLNGISSKEYLAKAEKLFREMKLKGMGPGATGRGAGGLIRGQASPIEDSLKG